MDLPIQWLEVMCNCMAVFYAICHCCPTHWTLISSGYSDEVTSTTCWKRLLECFLLSMPSFSYLQCVLNQVVCSML